MVEEEHLYSRRLLLLEYISKTVVSSFPSPSLESQSHPTTPFYNQV